MTFVNKWGIEYPEQLRRFVNSARIVDIDRKIMEVAAFITKAARNTDDAIMDIHEFVKKSMKVAKVPAVLDVPVMKASDQIQRVLSNPDAKNYSYNKVVLETALLRSLNIPARIGTYSCKIRDSPSFLSNRRLRSAFTPPESFHHATEVFTRDKDGKWRFKIKESWLPESECKLIEGTCSEEEREEWMKEREVRGIQRHVPCKKVRSDVDYPRAFSSIVNAGAMARKSSHLVDLIDPLE